MKQHPHTDPLCALVAYVNKRNKRSPGFKARVKKASRKLAYERAFEQLVAAVRKHKRDLLGGNGLELLAAFNYDHDEELWATTDRLVKKVKR